MHTFSQKLHRRLLLTIKILPLVAGVILLKYLFTVLHWQVFDLNPLLSSLVAGNVFILGFLLNGTLQDYKESERLHVSLCSSLETIFDECRAVEEQEEALGKGCMEHVLSIAENFKLWLYQSVRSKEMVKMIDQLNEFYASFQGKVPVQFIAHLKREQSLLRASFLRVHAIRETSFMTSAYAVAEIMSAGIVLMLLFTKNTLIEGLLLTGMVAYLMSYILLLVKELDHPFNYKKGNYGIENVSLRPVNTCIDQLLLGLEEKEQPIPVEVVSPNLDENEDAIFSLLSSAPSQSAS